MLKNPWEVAKATHSERSEESGSGNPDLIGARFLVAPIRSGLLGMTG
jgi:hypothetical protein